MMQCMCCIVSARQEKTSLSIERGHPIGGEDCDEQRYSGEISIKRLDRAEDFALSGFGKLQKR